MKNIILLIGFGVSCAISVNAQRNRLIEGTQSLTTYSFIYALERGDINTASRLLDSTSLNKNHKYKDSLVLWHNELKKYLSKAKLSVAVNHNETKYNLYSCRYASSAGIFFWIDLYYKTAEANSPIIKIIKTPEKELERIRKMRNDTPPPPPPGPPSDKIEIRPAGKK